MAFLPTNVNVSASAVNVDSYQASSSLFDIKNTRLINMYRHTGQYNNYPTTHSKYWPTDRLGMGTFSNNPGFDIYFGLSYTYWTQTYDGNTDQDYRKLRISDYFPSNFQPAAGDNFVVVVGATNGWVCGNAVTHHCFTYGTEVLGSTNYMKKSYDTDNSAGNPGKNSHSWTYYDGGDYVLVGGHYGFGGSSTSWGRMQMYIMGLRYNAGPGSGLYYSKPGTTGNTLDYTNSYSVYSAATYAAHNPQNWVCTSDAYYSAPAPDPGTGGISSPCCFSPESLVMMADGSKKSIKDIQVGDQVLSGDKNINTVLKTKTTTLDNRFLKRFAGYNFSCTDDHLLLTDKGWKTWRPDRLISNNSENAGLLLGENTYTPIDENDILIFIKDGVRVEIPYADLQVETISENEDFIVYDLTLDGNNTYMVEGFVVHNCGNSCFLIDSLVRMADGTDKPIQDVVIGDLLMGANSSVNPVLALNRPLLGKRLMAVINDEHATTLDHAHLRPDMTFGAVSLHEYLTGENNTIQKVIVADGTEEKWLLPGFHDHDLDLITQIELGDFLVGVDGPKQVNSLENINLPPETQLYNFVMGGDHTYFVNGYCVTGFLNGHDFDYRKWVPNGDAWTAAEYRKG